jgi:hypothetical protein
VTRKKYVWPQNLKDECKAYDKSNIRDRFYNFTSLFFNRMTHLFIEITDKRIFLVDEICKYSMDPFFPDEAPCEEPQDDDQKNREDDFGKQKKVKQKGYQESVSHVN